MTLHVLVIGDDAPSNVCGVYRTGMFVPYLAARDIELHFASPRIAGTLGPELAAATEAMRAGEHEFDAEVDAADVVVFRRMYRTHIACLVCSFRTWDAGEARSHGLQPGHHVELGLEWLVRPLFESLERGPERLRRKAVLYETDDDLLQIPAANALREMYLPDLDLVERMARRAEVVTTTTPVLAARLRRFNANVRVVRNAVDPAWYPPRPVGRPSPYPRILYYGSSGRLRDYAVCRDAVDLAARRHDGRRVWLGAPDHPERAAEIRKVADEVLPYVAGVPEFCRSLVDAVPDIGVAPVLDGEFERAKSELHWLDYTMAGAATVASRTMGDGPYRAIRPGVDGLLARSKSDWRESIERLAASQALRDDLAGRARERVLTEYTAAERAIEWAEAYRWAAEHAGLHAEDVPPETAPASSAATASRARSAAPSAAPGAAPTAPASGGASGERAADPDASDILNAYVAAQRFATRSPLRLVVGAGAPRAGWVSMDRRGPADIVLDPVFGLPFADGTVDALYVRLNLDDLGGAAIFLFQEAARALRPGGVLRIVTRDRALFVERRDRLANQGVVLRGADAVTPTFDANTLLGVLLAAGFSRSDCAAPDLSASEETAGLEAISGSLPADDLLVVEAVR